MTQDLTVGKPLSRIWQFAVPVLFGLLLQQVYSLVDTAIVGHALGVMALGGVGATGSVNFLVIGFCGGLCTGMAIPLAQAVGAGLDLSEERIGDGGGKMKPAEEVVSLAGSFFQSLLGGFCLRLIGLHCAGFQKLSGLGDI